MQSCCRWRGTQIEQSDKSGKMIIYHHGHSQPSAAGCGTRAPCFRPAAMKTRSSRRAPAEDPLSSDDEAPEAISGAVARDQVLELEKAERRAAQK